MLRSVVSGAARRGWQLSPQIAPAKSVFAFARHLSTESAAEIDPNLDLYKVLGVPKSADYPKIKAAYLKKAAMWHPDKNAHTVELASRKFNEVKIALDILSDETLRRQYDLKQFKSVLDILKNRPQETRAGY